ncbi:hypothetical protein GCM10022223_06040 [Kineosporia mesophila]|uniref:Capsular polysaccharide biosynthesis protein n=1 Tax=Kineosporia mesophila TaxID=566012 RepID=A0ABP6YZF4_9ACTN|nr:hypothetical protein [Kineosporia mesophila]MCD5350988.1 hypothetical protein [Kineosporia mesophila]
MSYLETLFVVLRRWRLSVPALMLSICLGAATFAAVPTQYQDSAQVLLLTSAHQPGERFAGNPFLGMNSALVATADVLRLRAGAPDTGERLAAKGATSTYEVVLDQSTAAPVLLVTTQDSSPETAHRTLLAVVSELESVLDDLQSRSGAPRSTWLNTMTISSLPRPVRLMNDSLRPAITVGTAVLAAALFLLFLSEGRRRRSLRLDAGDRPEATIVLPATVPSERFP